MLTTARLSANRDDFALIAMLGLFGLQIFEACGANVGDLGEERGHRVLKVRGKGDKTAPVPFAAWSRSRSSTPSRTASKGRSCATRSVGGWIGTPRPADSKSCPRRPGSGCRGWHPHVLRQTFVTTMLDAGVSLRDVQTAARHADPKTTMRYDRAGKNLDRHPNDILAAYLASST